MNAKHNGATTNTSSKGRKFSHLSGRRFTFRHDLDDVLCLFEKVFKKPANRELWTWKYQPPWIDESYAWMGLHRDQVIGYIGAVPLRGQLNGKQVFFFQFGDIMVSPDFRSLGAYLQWNPKNLIEEIRSEQPDAFIYGFTSQKLARFYKWYASSVRNTYVEWSNDYIVQALPNESDRSDVSIHIREWSWNALELDEIWQRQKETIKIGLIRDRAYLDWRYANHPTIEYCLFGVYHRDVPVGWFVTGKRMPERPSEDEVRIQDILIPSDIRVSVLREVASVFHAKSTVLWLPAHCVEPDMESRKTNWQTIYYPLCDAVTKDHLASNIYYTLGEADEWWW